MEEVDMESILTSIKKLLGIHADYVVFDDDIIMHTNTVFGVLNQLGIGPEQGFMITGTTEVWDDYITDFNINMVKTFIFMKVKMTFDPPASAALIESFQRAIGELEWRLELEGQKNSSDDK